MVLSHSPPTSHSQETLLAGSHYKNGYELIRCCSSSTASHVVASFVVLNAARSSAMTSEGRAYKLIPHPRSLIFPAAMPRASHPKIATAQAHLFLCLSSSKGRDKQPMLACLPKEIPQHPNVVACLFFAPKSFQQRTAQKYAFAHAYKAVSSRSLTFAKTLVMCALQKIH